MPAIVLPRRGLKVKGKELSPSSPPPGPSEPPPNPPVPKPKPAYKNADRATYITDPATGEKYYQCPLCPKRLKGHLTIHLRTHNGRKPWQCSKCSKSFSQKCNLQTHEKSVHEAKKVFKCELCPKSFDYKKNLERHVSAHLLEKPYKCDHCPRQYSSVDALCKHRRVHTGEKPYHCVFCPDLKMAQYGEFMNHLRRHIGERPYFCKFCDKTFSSSGNLSTHRRTVHLKTLREMVDPVSCLFCDREFLNSQRLFHHLRRAHIGEDPTSLRSPQFSSSAEGKKPQAPLQCKDPNCGSSFMSSRSLRRHWLSSHTPKSEWPHFCVFCEKGFTEYKGLHEHTIKHTKECHQECPVCFQRFQWRSTLRAHIRTKHKNKKSKPKIMFKL